jgi:hypothetical protein
MGGSMKVDLTPAELDALCHMLVQFDRMKLSPEDVYHAGCCYTKFRVAHQEAVKDIPGFSKEILFRPVREFLDDAMKEAIPIKSLEEIRHFYSKEFPLQGKLKVKPYGYDERINWDTWLVVETVDGQDRACGYTNGYIE